jgi:hypothetical protein
VVGLVFSALALVSQLIVHAVTYVPAIPLAPIDAAWVMLAPLGVLAAMFYLHDNPLLRRLGDVRSYSERAARSKAAWKELPRGLRWSTAIVGAYLAVVTACALVALSSGAPQGIVGGERRVGSRKLHIATRVVSAQEYQRLVGHEVRLLSGFGILVTWWPVLAFVWDRRRARRAHADDS